MSGSLIGRVVTVREGAYLPHWTLDGATYAVCFRLADSLPQAVVDAWRHERAALLKEAGANPTVAQREANRLFHRQGEFWQPEYYDHLVRDAHDLAHAVRYVMENPAKGRLSDWPWVWGRRADQD